MKRMIVVLVVVLYLLPGVVFSATFTFLSTFTYLPYVGIATSTGDEGKYGKIGATIGGEVFYPLSQSISLGLNLGFSGWKQDEDKVQEKLGYPAGEEYSRYSNSDILLKLIVPSTSDNNNLFPFAQIGYGLYTGYNFTVEHPDGPGHIQSSVTYWTTYCQGLSIGGGVIFKYNDKWGIQIHYLYRSLGFKMKRLSFHTVNLGYLIF